MRPPTVIEHGRLIAGRHPCAWGAENAWLEVEDLVAAGVTLFVDLTQPGELEPYGSLVQAPARYVNRPIRDFSILVSLLVLTGGGPGYLTETLTVRMYWEAFTNFRMGTASAVATTIFAINMLFSLIYLRLMKAEQH